MGKLVVGVGVNDANYPVVRFEMVSGKRKRVWICHYYQTWMNMLNRVYSTYPSNDAYRGNITVCDEWLTFSTFKSWMESQDWRGKELDKDLKGCKLYSPANCIFVSKDVNIFCRLFNKQTNTGVPGIIKHKTGYSARTTANGIEYGTFVDTIEEAKQYLQSIRLGWVEGLPDTKEVKELLRAYILRKYAG